MGRSIRVHLVKNTLLVAGTLCLLATSVPAGDSKDASRKADPILRAMFLRPTPELNLDTVGLLGGQEFSSSVIAVDLLTQGFTSTSEVALILEGNVDSDALAAAGALVNTRAGRICTIHTHLSRITDLLDLDGVDRLSADGPVDPLIDTGALAIDANGMWGGVPPVYPPSGFTGGGVIIGVVDSGLDLTHEDFRTSGGATRVKFAWDQTSKGPHPSGFSYGREYTEAMINAGQAKAFRDRGGHGTHVTSIAAGNGRATGNGQPAYRYVGIAPEADLIVVKTNFSRTGVIDGVNYIFHRAAMLGKPAVVNLSLGSHRGAHDGSFSVDQAISSLTGPGRLVSAAAGNEGNDPIHTQITIAQDGLIYEVPFIIPQTVQSMKPEFLLIEGWHDSLDGVFEVKLRSPNGLETGWILPGMSSGYISDADGSRIVDNDLIGNGRGTRCISILVERGSTASARPAPGTWLLLVKRVRGQRGGSHWWISQSSGLVPRFTSSDFAWSIASPASADDVIATGAYCTRTVWTNASGIDTSYGGGAQLNAVADFSSRGPRRDGVVKPEIVAPGDGIAAAVSADAHMSKGFRTEDQVHGLMRGTSQATALTTGVLALLLQQRPSLTPAQARQELIRRATRDSFTGVSPNPIYGFGKLNTTPTMNYVLDVRIEGPYPNPVQSEATFRFGLTEENLAGGTNARLRIFEVRTWRLVGESRVFTRPGAYEWKWTVTSGETLQDGTYLAQLRVGEKVTAVRFEKVGGS
jgi:subtilisin family serine protease